ncbi:MAG: FAD-dependent oxidoreductase [Burkholderiales bacterium]|nr:FAD-dependent oxidoreductase [Burkholderiales bacterium]
MTQRILILGAGFAGLWSAVGAARQLAETRRAHGPIEILVVNARPFHSIRVRNYELDAEASRVPLADVFEPIGVAWVQGTVQHIDVAARKVQVATAEGAKTFDYACLVMALGSALVRPPIPGLADYAFDVDTDEGAVKLLEHLRSLPLQPDSAGRYTAVVIGAGLTGSEIASELPARLAKIACGAAGTRVLLLDHAPRIADQMGEAQRVIEQALRDMGVELRPGVRVARVLAGDVALESGEIIPASTTIWCAGMRASALTKAFPVTLDTLGRIPVDEFLRVKGVPGVFAAGDCANFPIDGTNDCVMSCQYSRPMGRFCGHNAAAELLGEPLLPLRIDWYITCVDLGPWGAVYTEGRERRLATEGAQAKRTKQLINRHRIYPPTNRNREDILRAAAPVVEAAPSKNVAAAT